MHLFPTSEDVGGEPRSQARESRRVAQVARPGEMILEAQ